MTVSIGVAFAESVARALAGHDGANCRSCALPGKSRGRNCVFLDAKSRTRLISSLRMPAGTISRYSRQQPVLRELFIGLQATRSEAGAPAKLGDYCNTTSKNQNMRALRSISLAFLFCLCTAVCLFAQSLRFEITVPASAHAAPITGRVFVILSRQESNDLLNEIGSWEQETPFFGVDVSNLAPGSAATIDADTLGYPLKSLREIPAGDYYVQALVNVYTEFHRSDGHTIWAHMDQWEGQQFNRSPGNLYSDVQKVHLDPAAGYDVHLQANHVIPAIKIPADTRWVKHIKLQSKLLSKFWGQPIFIGATVLAAQGLRQASGCALSGHLRARTLRAGAAFIHADRSSRRWFEVEDHGLRGLSGVERRQLPAHDCRHLPAPDAVLRRFLRRELGQRRPVRRCPDAGTDSLPGGTLPHHSPAVGARTDRRLDRRLGVAGAGALSSRLFRRHLDRLPRSHRLSPLPAHRTSTATRMHSRFPDYEWVARERPLMRTAEGQVVETVRQMSQLEEVLGSHGRSGQQLEAWEAVYGPVGADGYPEPLWDKRTGVINRKVADYMRDHGYDLRDYADKNWSKIGPMLTDNVFIWVGDMDNFYLNLAVYDMEDFFKKHPEAKAHFEYGRPEKGHGWFPWSIADFVKMMSRPCRQPTRLRAPISGPGTTEKRMNVSSSLLSSDSARCWPGFLGALTGLGGGVVVVPMLALLFHVDIQYAIGASLVSVIATSSGAAAAYVREGYSNIRIGMFLETATTIGAHGRRLSSP